MTETVKRRTLDLTTLVLERGAHDPDHTFCIMEAVAYIAGERWTDTPQCVSPAIGAFLRNWNDSVDDAFRQRLKPYIERVLHTRTTLADEETRAWLATDWLVRVQAPAWLDLAGLTDDATALRNLPTLTSSEIAVAVQSVLEGARQRAAAAGDAAGDAALAAAWDAALAAAWDAAGDAALAAAGDAALAAAWAAALAAALAAAWDAAWAAAWDAAGDAAWAAAKERLAPTVTQLQESAFTLLDAMIAVGSVGAVPGRPE